MPLKAREPMIVVAIPSMTDACSRTRILRMRVMLLFSQLKAERGRPET
jgi:hypothetical protein